MSHVIEDTIQNRTNVVAADLRRIALKLDELCRDSLAAGSRQVISLGEASQDVHRALLALDLERVSTPSVPYVKEWA